MNRFDQALRIIEKADQLSLGLILDSFHYEQAPESPFETAHVFMRSLLQMEERAGHAVA